MLSRDRVFLTAIEGGRLLTLATNDLGDENYAMPALAHGALSVRTKGRLFQCGISPGDAAAPP